jgi:hypothetical protein
MVNFLSLQSMKNAFVKYSNILYADYEMCQGTE